MALFRCSSSSGGGGSKWVTPTNDSGTHWYANWGFDADTLLILFTYNTTKYVMICDSSSAWRATSAASWQAAASTGITWNGKTGATFDFGIALTNFTVCPMVGKPNGYFS